MNKNGIPCNVIVDLLPLYKEDICSEETKDLVEEHLRSCEDCRQLCEQLTVPQNEKKNVPDEAETFKKVGKKLKSGKLYKQVMIILITAFAAVNVAWLKLKFFPYKDYATDMIEYEKDDGTLYQQFYVDWYYNVDFPNYLDFFSGKLYLWKSANYKENKVKELRIIPRIIGETKYAVTINDERGVYGIPITGSLEFDPSGYKVHDNDEKMKQLINENRDEIEELMNAAHEKWGEYLK
ncbi:MAG: zf-HC2 domain-containing protein [Ruminococcus sp.]|uniref:zf-HC2 domain-containing protein n=1 Tax=Ruminococcus sp. TaxID=41978 RepID=UPI0025EF6287|nr:zf-HC2 domain-containing protein [Ruminococcus sp.]MCR5600236.1 zf-HC2 domain-containing protein [Ruminococcus sp.]